MRASYVFKHAYNEAVRDTETQASNTTETKAGRSRAILPSDQSSDCGFIGKADEQGLNSQHLQCMYLGSHASVQVCGSLIDWISGARPQGCTDLQSPVDAWIIGLGIVHSATWQIQYAVVQGCVRLRNALKCILEAMFTVK